MDYISITWKNPVCKLVIVCLQYCYCTFSLYSYIMMSGPEGTLSQAGSMDNNNYLY